MADYTWVFRAEEKEGDSRTEDGILICGVCGKPKEKMSDSVGCPVRVRCDCEQKDYERRMEKERRDNEAQERERFRERARLCFRGLGPEGTRKAEKMTFENDLFCGSRQSEYCRRYADGFEEMLRDNIGIVLHGPVGTGKTFLASAICNRVMKKGFSAVFFNLGDIALKSISIREAEREAAHNDLLSPDLIVFDDLGAGRRSEYTDEGIYTAINARYAANKPAVFTTNLRPADFENQQDDRQKRILSRIVGMCDFIPVEGPDKRRGEHNGKRWRFASLVKGEERK